jgi:ribosomal protein S18 acetylase RimI-like enzyme
MFTSTRANADDAPAIAALHIASWRDAYRAELPADYLAAIDLDERVESWRKRVAAGTIVLLEKNGDSLAGFCACGPSRDDDADPSHTWEIENLHVAPTLRGGGIGSRLFDQASLLARDHGADELSLWVVETNSRARRFYEAHGMHADGATQRHVLAPGVSIAEVRYRLAFVPRDSSHAGGAPSATDAKKVATSSSKGAAPPAGDQMNR